ncbi:MAG: outer membrane beta-barrel protein [Candidatus Saccharicenans sp.]
MKKIISILISLIAIQTLVFVPRLAAASGPSFEIGFSYGLRSVVNSDIKEVYGNGTSYFPSVALIWKGLMFGAGYEGGYKRDGLIGIYQEATTLSVAGPEVFIGYQLQLGIFSPYVKVGYGFYSYKQTIESEYVSDYPVDGSKSGLIFSGGFKIYPIKHLFIAAEVKYGHLKVKPYDIEVDLGGMRLNGGLGIRF